MSDFTGHVPAYDAIGVLDGAALPGRMRVAEERLNTGLAGQLLMFGELAAVIKGDCVPGPFGQTAEDMSQHFAGFQRRFGLQGGCDE